MLKFSPRKTWISAIALAIVIACGVGVGISTQSQWEARVANMELRDSAEILAQYATLNCETEVYLLRYLTTAKDRDLSTLRNAAVQARAMLKQLRQHHLPADKEDLARLEALAEQKSQQVNNAIKRQTLSKIDRASSEAISQHIKQIKSAIESRISNNRKIYDQQSTASRFLLNGVWIGTVVLVVIFARARQHWLSEQHLRLEQAETQLACDRAMHQAIEAERQKMTQYLGHDLDNLLTSVLSSAELLKRQNLTDRAQKHSDRILRASRDLRDYLKEFRIALEGNSIELQLHLTEVDLIQLATNAISSPSALRHNNGHSVELQFVGQPVLVQADARLLERVLINLIANAVKYSPDGGEVLVCIDFAQPVTISVCDNGLGVSEEIQSTLFAPFQRGSNVGSIQGTGLGLAFVKEVVIAHGWEIDVLSDARSACVEKVWRTMFRLTLRQLA